LHVASSTAAGQIIIGGEDTTFGLNQIAGQLDFRSSDSTLTTNGIVGRIASVSENSAGTLYGLAFYTNPAFDTFEEQMRIDNDGNVGINVAVPVSVLDVNDDGATGTGFRITGGGNNGPLGVFGRYVGGTGTTTISSSGNDPQISFESSTNTFSLGTDGALFRISANTTIGTSDALSIDATGNVGIGPNATTPLSLLHAGAANGDIGTITVGGGSTAVTLGQIPAQLDFRTNDSQLSGDNEVIARIASVAQNTAGTFYGLAFYTATSFNNLEEKMRIDNNGRVIIGEGSATTTISSTGSNPQVAFESSTNTFSLGTDGSVFKISENSTIGTNDLLTILSGGSVGVGDTTPDGKFEIRQTAAADIFNLYDNTTNVFTVRDGGRVGIGTSNPDAKLAVVVSDTDNTNGVLINFDETSTFTALEIDSETASALVPAVDITGAFGLRVRSDLTGGRGLLVSRNINEAGANPLVSFVDDNTTNTQTTLRVQQDGTGDIVNIFDGGTEVFTILNGGNVGIGTTTPGSLLSIGDTAGINFTTATSTFSSSGGINLASGCFSIAGTCVGGGGGSGTVGAGTIGQFPYYAANGTDLTATSSLFLATSGNVGIGSTSPLAKLVVSGTRGTSNEGQLVVVGDNDHAYLQIQSNDPANRETGIQFTGLGTLAAPDWSIRTQANSSDLRFFTSGAGGTALTLTAAGNVGIGTAAPDTILRIDDNAGTGTGLKVTGGGAGGALATFVRDVGANATTTINADAGDPQIVFESTGEAFSMGLDGTIFKISDNTALGTNDRLTINSSGLVGIGVPSAAYQLDVSRAGQQVARFTSTATNVNADVLIVDQDNNSSRAALQIQGNAGATEVLFASSGGNVGIGSTSPSDKLVVDGAIRITPTSTAFDAGKPGRIYYRDTNGLSLQGATGSVNDLTLQTPAGQLLLANPTGTNDVAFNATNARVGIGLTAPNTPLHVFSATGDTLARFQSGDAITRIILEDSAGTAFIEGRGGEISFPSGNVGIGTTSPTEQLSVANRLYVGGTGTSTFENNLNVRGQLQIGTGSIYLRDNATSTFAGGIDISAGCFTIAGGSCLGGDTGTVGAGTTGQFPYYALGGTTLTATSSLFLGSNGFIGVGNTSPLNLLDVGSAGNAAFGTTPDVALQISSTVDNDEVALKLFVADGGSNKRAKFFLDDSNDTYGLDVSYISNAPDFVIKNLNSETFRVESSGAVGIGASNPVANLQIQEGLSPTLTSTPAQLMIVSGAPQIIFDEANEPVNNRLWDFAVVNEQFQANVLSDTATAVSWLTVDRTANTVDQIVFPNGNVGIGTTSPTTALEVAGDFRVGDASSFNTFVVNSLFDRVAIGTGANPLGKLEVEVSDADNTRGIFIDMNETGSYNALFVDSESTAAAAVQINGYQPLSITPDIANGYGIQVLRNLPEAGTSPLINFIEDNTSNTQTVLRVQQDGTGDIVNIFDGTTEVFTVLNGGNVGIGTAAPDTIFRIDDNAGTGTGLKVTGGGAGGALATFVRDVGANATTTISGNGANPQIVFESTSNAFAVGLDGTNFKISDNTALGTNDRLTINSSGLVGIGTAAPGQELDVVGAVSTSVVAASITDESAVTLRVNYPDPGTVFSGYGTGIKMGMRDRGGVYLGQVYETTSKDFSAFTIYTGSDSASTWTEKFRIDSNGNVGIGSTSPSDRLVVDGAIRVTSNLGFDANKGGRIYKQSTNGLAIQGVSGSTNDFTLQTPAGQLILANPTGTNDVVFNATSARVGIGSSSPLAKLVVSGTRGAGNEGQLVVVGESDHAYIQIQSNDPTNRETGIQFAGLGALGNPDWSIRTQANSSDLRFFTSGTGGTVLALTDTGNVGIGTAGPSTALTLGANTSGGTELTMTANLSGGRTSYQTGTNVLVGATASSGGSYPFNEAGNLILQSRAAGAARDIVFATGITTPATRMVIARDGNVGIGSTSPSDRLVVDGAIRVTSNLGFDANKGGRIYKQSTYSRKPNRD